MVQVTGSNNMKLLTKNTIWFLLIMLPLLAAGGIYLYQQFDKELKKEMDEELVNDQIQWLLYFKSIPDDSPVFRITTPEFSIHPAKGPADAQPLLKTIMQYQEVEHKEVPYRQLEQVIRIRENFYTLTIRKSLIEKDDLIRNIALVMTLAFIGLLLFVILVNRLISRSIWRPFYQSLEKMEKLQLEQMPHLTFPDTAVTEFNRLNEVLLNATSRMYHDFVIMKELTEDAAHEMQTPLAIAQNRLELLLQDEALQPTQLKSIAQTHEALQRLSHLNHNMLFMAKIGNKQFMPAGNISIRAVLEKHLRLFEELIRDKDLMVRTDISGDLSLSLHPLLADTLISNLLGNAIKYNYPKGAITIQLNEQLFSICNTSEYPQIPATQLFQRFKKNASVLENSNGLGLAIVKKITDTNNLKIYYIHKEHEHHFIVRPNPHRH
ncbi:HAMP domain-containing sensor histidine kinase [Chitinophaga sp.]|uniref:sensor histidine kinase n=1 Tax=Chitinophaga sp. TaxID=1869181 RepID=UPI0031E43C55